MPKLSLTSITPTIDGSGNVILHILVIDEAGNEVYGAGSGDVILAGADLVTAMASGTVAQKAAAIKVLILAAKPEWAKETVNAVNTANLLAVAQSTALTALVPGLPYKFTL